MNIEEIMKMKVSLYKRVTTNKSCNTITIDDYLHKLTPAARKVITELRKVNETNPKLAKINKCEELPCITISGVFEGERQADEVTEQNPIICIDIDDLPEGMTWDEVKKKVFELPYVFYVSLSARGEGVFALVHYNMKNSLLNTFYALEQDMKEMGIIIDRSCKDICRLRFVSYDEDALEKTGEIEMYDKVLEKPGYVEYNKTEYKKSEHQRYSTEGDVYIDDYFTLKVIAYLIKHCGYRADTYDEWLMDGFRLATFEYGYNLFMYLSQKSEGWNKLEADRKWRECVKTTKMTKECLLHYYRVAREKLGPDWKFIIRN